MLAGKIYKDALVNLALTIMNPLTNTKKNLKFITYSAYFSISLTYFFLDIMDHEDPSQAKSHKVAVENLMEKVFGPTPYVFRFKPSTNPLAKDSEELAGNRKATSATSNMLPRDPFERAKLMPLRDHR